MSSIQAPLEGKESCRHCGSPLFDDDTEFCCGGCETAWHVIRGRGLEEYYRFRDPDKSAPVNNNHASFDYLDSDEYRAQHTRQEGNLFHADWYLGGLQCPACAWLVEKVVMDHEDVEQAELNFGAGRLALVFKPEANLKLLAENLADLGYTAGLQPDRGQARNRELLKLGISGAIAANIMLMSMPFYTGLSEGPYALLFGWISLFLSIPLLFYCGRNFFTRAFAALKHRAVDLDLPIALGLGSAFVLSVVNLLRGDLHHIWFDSMGMLVFFLLTGRYVQQTGVVKALSASRALLARMPRLVELFRNNQWIQMPAAEIQPGEQIRASSGDVIAVDGVLESDEAVFNMHVVSGESHPIRLTRGAEILAGAVNMGSRIRMTATATYDDSRFARLEEMAKRLREHRTDRLGSWPAAAFVAAVTLCALTGVWMWWSVSPLHSFSVALTVFIVACPCALALAVPTSHAFALREASRLGIRVKDTGVFDKLERIENLVFDKTGILTRGKPSIVARVLLTPRPHWLESAVLTLESETRHPIVEAFREAIEPRLLVGAPQQTRVIPGAGISGCIDGVDLVISSLEGLGRFHIAPDDIETMKIICNQLPEGSTRVCVLEDGKPAAVYGLEDPIRGEVPQLVEQLNNKELNMILLSGDHQQAVDRTGTQLGMEQRFGAMKPEDKLARVQGMDHTLMAGDGLNDMGALAAAELSVTHDQATDAAIRFADVIFQGRDMSRLNKMFDLATTVRLAIVRGICLSLIYNSVTVVLALNGSIGPLAAAILMPLSSLSLVGITGFTFNRRRLLWES